MEVCGDVTLLVLHKSRLQFALFFLLIFITDLHAFTDHLLLLLLLASSVYGASIQTSHLHLR